MSTRIPCCVPFCRRRTRRPEALGDGWEWICPTHWRAIPLVRRRAYGRLQRVWYGPDGHGMTLAAIRAHPRYGSRAVHRVAVGRLWARLKRMAIERALIHG